jgi:hypothetical protein
MQELRREWIMAKKAERVPVTGQFGRGADVFFGPVTEEEQDTSTPVQQEAVKPVEQQNSIPVEQSTSKPGYQRASKPGSWQVYEGDILYHS